jgi:hypothetical protein
MLSVKGKEGREVKRGNWGASRQHHFCNVHKNKDQEKKKEKNSYK